MSTCVSSCNSSPVTAGATVQVIDRLFNSTDTATVIEDATVAWTMPNVDDGGNPATGAMIWDPAFVYEGITGWYVGSIPAATTAGLADTIQDIEIDGTGGSLGGTYKRKLEREFV